MSLDSKDISETGLRAIRWTMLTGGLIIAVILFALASTSVQAEQSQLRARIDLRSEVELPSTDILQAGVLNFEEFAADLIWIQALQYFGRQERAERTPVSLDEYADAVAGLDPYFYEIYPWFVATYRGSRFPISAEDIRTMNRFLDRGIERFPNRWRLPYKAGMNYIGYSKNRAPRERLEEVESAIDYLQTAAALPGASSNIPMTISWLYERRRQLRDQLKESDEKTASAKATDSRIEYLTDVYFLVEDPSTRRHIRASLAESAEGRRALKQRIQDYSNQFESSRELGWTYLSDRLWAWTAASQSLPFASRDDSSSDDRESP